MASGAGKSAAFMLLILNVFLYLIVIAIASWAVNHGIERSGETASALSLPARLFPRYYPFGNMATGLVIIVSLIAGVLGFTTSVTGIITCSEFTCSCFFSCILASHNAGHGVGMQRDRYRLD